MSWPSGRVSASSLAAAALLLGAAASAQAELRFKRCKNSLAPCARLSVPLDRSGATPGRVSLYIERTRAFRRPSRGVVFALAGGPGQAASFSFMGDALGTVAPAFRRRDLIVFDQRGTGRSGALRCPALQRSNLFDAGRQAGVCARRLGSRRSHYTSRASVEDIEAIRRELGAPRITLYGTSYGVKVALGYALTYPGNVERLVLDSVVEADGPDSFYLDTLAALPRALRSLCRAGCSSFSSDPVADLSALTARIGAGRLRGAVIDAGRRRVTTVTRGELLLILLAGDFDPALRAATPGAVRAALDGDAVPLLRLKRRSISVDAQPPPTRLLSTGLFAATTCEEGTFPWARTTPPDPLERRRRAEAAAAALPAGAFAPFDPGAILDNDLLQLCDRWPAAPTAPGFGPGPLPNVPTLILEGEDDLRTPVESARRVAALLPQSRLVISPATGHSALSSDMSGCAARAFARFFADRAIADCPRRRRRFQATPPPPRALSAVTPARGSAGVRGRALGALGLTLRDVAQDSLTQFVAGDSRDLARGGGLRSGRYRITPGNTLHLRGVAFVPGVRVSGVVKRFGQPRQLGRLSLSGPAGPRGTVRLQGRRVSGRLGGQRVTARLGGGASRARVAAARLPGPAGR